MLEFLAAVRSAFKGLAPITYALNSRLQPNASLAIRCKSFKSPVPPATNNCCSRYVVSVGAYKIRKQLSLYQYAFAPALFQTVICSSNFSPIRRQDKCRPCCKKCCRRGAIYALQNCRCRRGELCASSGSTASQKHISK